MDGLRHCVGIPSQADLHKTLEVHLQNASNADPGRIAPKAYQEKIA